MQHPGVPRVLGEGAQSVDDAPSQVTHAELRGHGDARESTRTIVEVARCDGTGHHLESSSGGVDDDQNDSVSSLPQRLEQALRGRPRISFQGTDEHREVQSARLVRPARRHGRWRRTVALRTPHQRALAPPGLRCTSSARSAASTVRHRRIGGRPVEPHRGGPPRQTWPVARGADRGRDRSQQPDDPDDRQRDADVDQRGSAPRDGRARTSSSSPESASAGAEATSATSSRATPAAVAREHGDDPPAARRSYGCVVLIAHEKGAYWPGSSASTAANRRASAAPSGTAVVEQHEAFRSRRGGRRQFGYSRSVPGWLIARRSPTASHSANPEQPAGRTGQLGVQRDDGLVGRGCDASRVRPAQEAGPDAAPPARRRRIVASCGALLARSAVSSPSRSRIARCSPRR